MKSEQEIRDFLNMLRNYRDRSQAYVNACDLLIKYEEQDLEELLKSAAAKAKEHLVVPPRTTRRSFGKTKKYPFKQMEVGDWFIYGEYSKKSFAKARTAIWQFLHKPRKSYSSAGKEFRVRKIDNNAVVTRTK